MNRRLAVVTILLLALTVTFNSCDGDRRSGVAEQKSDSATEWFSGGVLWTGDSLHLKPIENRTIDKDNADFNNGALLRSWSFDDSTDAGKIGGGFFARVGRYHNDGPSADLHNLAPMTASAWIKPLSVSSSACGTVISKRTHAHENGWHFGFSGDGDPVLEFTVAYAGSSRLRAVADEPVTLGEWNHVAVTWDGGGHPRTVNLYINGRRSGIKQFAVGAGGRDNDAAASLLIGARHADPTCFFDGTIDEVLLYSRALVADEVQRIHERQRDAYAQSGVYVSNVFDSTNNEFNWGKFIPVPRKPYGKELIAKNQSEVIEYAEGGVDTNGLVGLWHLNSDSGNTVRDDSGNGIHGNLYRSDGDGPEYASGVFKEAMVFDGFGDSIELPPAPFRFEPNGHYTWAFWLKPKAFDQYTRVLFQRAVGRAGIGVDVHNRGKKFAHGVDFFVSHQDGIGMGVSSYPGVLDVEQFSLVVVTYAGSLPLQQRLTIYIDGQDQTDRATFGASGTLAGFTPSAVTVGGYGRNNLERSFAGLIDEVSYWQRAVNSEEAMALYDRGIFRVHYQVRSCSQPDCAGEPFVGPGGDPDRYFSEAMNSFASIPIFLLSDVLQPKRYFQYKIDLETLNREKTPIIDAVKFDGTNTPWW